MEATSPVLPSSPQYPEIIAGANQQYLPMLPSVGIMYSDGTRSVISCYRLTWEERFSVLFGGKVWWEQFTFGHPLQPQKMYVEEPLRDNGAK
jgi:hypothetical protein